MDKANVAKELNHQMRLINNISSTKNIEDIGVPMLGEMETVDFKVLYSKLVSESVLSLLDSNDVRIKNFITSDKYTMGELINMVEKALPLLIFGAKYEMRDDVNEEIELAAGYRLIDLEDNNKLIQLEISPYHNDCESGFILSLTYNSYVESIIEGRAVELVKKHVRPISTVFVYKGYDDQLVFKMSTSEIDVLPKITSDIISTYTISAANNCYKCHSKGIYKKCFDTVSASEKLCELMSDNYQFNRNSFGKGLDIQIIEGRSLVVPRYMVDIYSERINVISALNHLMIVMKLRKQCLDDENSQGVRLGGDSEDTTLIDEKEEIQSKNLQSSTYFKFDVEKFKSLLKDKPRTSKFKAKKTLDLLTRYFYFGSYDKSNTELVRLRMLYEIDKYLNKHYLTVYPDSDMIKCLNSYLIRIDDFITDVEIKTKYMPVNDRVDINVFESNEENKQLYKKIVGEFIRIRDFHRTPHVFDEFIQCIYLAFVESINCGLSRLSEYRGEVERVLFVYETKLIDEFEKFCIYKCQ